jgi:hypothetical protein
MGHRAVPLCLRCCAPASVLAEKQPLVDVDAGPCLAMDGRVDNRSELAAALKESGFNLTSGMYGQRARRHGFSGHD